MTSEPKPSVTSNPRIRQILWGWGIAFAVGLFVTVALAVIDWTPSDWVTQLAFYMGLFWIANAIRWICCGYWGKADVIGEVEQKPAPLPSVARQTKPVGLIDSMIVPVIGYALPLAIFVTISFIIHTDDFAAFGVTVSIIFGMALLIALFFGLSLYEEDRPGRFGPESFKMPTKDDQNP